MFVMRMIKGPWGEQKAGKWQDWDTWPFSSSTSTLATSKALLLTFVPPRQCQNLDVLLSLGKNFHQLYHIMWGWKRGRKKPKSPPRGQPRPFPQGSTIGSPGQVAKQQGFERSRGT